MRTLTLLALCAMAAVCVADSSESNEIDDAMFLRRRDANFFMRPARPSNPWERMRAKSPYELNREQCEEFRPCDLLARQVGHRQAYGRFFGNARSYSTGYRQQRPHRQRGSRSRQHYYQY
ncbi:matrix Gla protein [Rhinoraja longicauda]